VTEPPPTEPRYPFLHVEVDAADEDAVSGALWELGATGVEVRDDATLAKGPAAGRTLLVASFDAREAAAAAVESLREALPALAPRIEEVVGDAWRDAWKEHFQPFALTPRIMVRPPWVPEAEVVRGPEVLTVLELEPGRAFGTGLHATTSLVARALDAESDRLKDTVVLDAGTGSGILALVALTLGAARVVAFDVDPDVIEVVRENAARNGLQDRVEAFAGTVEDVRVESPRSGPEKFPWVLANIEARVLDPIAEALAERVAPGGDLVLSGILAGEEERLIARYTAPAIGLTLHRVTRDEGSGPDRWICLHLRRG
jgi:ribosomal protein L11 methyltransferase